jgi:hypothetical protein
MKAEIIGHSKQLTTQRFQFHQMKSFETARRNKRVYIVNQNGKECTT